MARLGVALWVVAHLWLAHPSAARSLPVNHCRLRLAARGSNRRAPGDWSLPRITASSGAATSLGADDTDGPLSSVENVQGEGSFATIRKFTRPHTIRGTILASFAGVARALIEHPGTISLTLVPRAIAGLAALLMGNAYIVGINQIYDVDIDKINKPFLPVASGEMSPRTAWVLVVTSLGAGLTIVRQCFSPLIFMLYATGLAVGGLYSVPPIQLKRFPIAAGLIISTVRGFFLNFGVYYAVREAIGVPFAWNPVVGFIASFMTVFAAVIAVTKDLPDVAGDAAYKVTTFATRFGVGTVARGAVATLTTAYAGAGLVALSPLGKAFHRIPMIAGHAFLAFKLLRTYAQLDPSSLPSIRQFYRGIWDLFYLEYMLYPFI